MYRLDDMLYELDLRGRWAQVYTACRPNIGTQSHAFMQYEVWNRLNGKTKAQQIIKLALALQSNDGLSFVITLRVSLEPGTEGGSLRGPNLRATYFLVVRFDWIISSLQCFISHGEPIVGNIGLVYVQRCLETMVQGCRSVGTSSVAWISLFSWNALLITVG